MLAPHRRQHVGRWRDVNCIWMWKTQRYRSTNKPCTFDFFAAIRSAITWGWGRRDGLTEYASTKISQEAPQMRRGEGARQIKMSNQCRQAARSQPRDDTADFCKYKSVMISALVMKVFVLLVDMKDSEVRSAEAKQSEGLCR